MKRQLLQPSLSSEARIALDAAIADLGHGGQASAGNRGNQALSYSSDIVCCGIAHPTYGVDVDKFLDKGRGQNKALAGLVENSTSNWGYLVLHGPVVSAYSASEFNM